MIQIKHSVSGDVLHTINANSLLRANLSKQNLSEANLEDLDLTGANLSDTNLTGAILTRTRLTDANLSKAILQKANLAGTRFLRTNLKETDFNGANFYETIFINCKSLHQALHLDQVLHNGPSTLDARTLRINTQYLDDMFLTGVGYTFEEIRMLRKIYVATYKYLSCFISYAHQDSKFAIQLHRDLEAYNVPCWLDLVNLNVGDLWRREVHENIKKRDKVIIICSAFSLCSKEVVEEIIEAIEEERTSNKQKLFPIRLDEFIFSKEAEELAYETLPDRQRREDWLTYLRDYHVPLFGKKSNNKDYIVPFERLLEKLKMA